MAGRLGSDALSEAGVVVLAGGTGGAKLARGMLDVVGEGLTVVANTADDVVVYGAHVSPDPDLVAYWLADRIDERGWGVRGDTFEVMEALRALGVDTWFTLGDRDLAACLHRRARLDAGARLTEAIGELGAALGVRARVLPMADEPVRTRVRARGRWHPFQEFMVREGAAGPVEDVVLEGLEAARPTPEVLTAVADADAIVIGPSNPVVSVGPILDLPGMRAALADARAPVVAVSPIVEGRVLKGPTEPFLTWAGREATAAGVAEGYAGAIDGFVADDDVDGVPLLLTDVAMPDAAARRRLAEETLRFALGLAGDG